MQRPLRFELLVFDLDGTLIDSRLDLAHSVNAVLTSLGREKLPVETVVSFVGDGALDLLRRSLQAGGIPQAETEEMLPDVFSDFMEYYQLHCLDYTLPYPGVISMLEQLHGCRKAILTNKPLAPALKILNGLVMNGYFDLVVPGDGPHGKKPDPAGLGYILSTLGVSPSEALMIGDSVQDLQTAKAANCGFAAFLNGMGDRKTLQADASDLAFLSWDAFSGILTGKMEPRQ